MVDFLFDLLLVSSKTQYELLHVCTVCSMKLTMSLVAHVTPIYNQKTVSGPLRLLTNTYASQNST